MIVVALTGALALSPELESQFLRIDANGDGSISQHEAWADRQVERRFELADRNQNGRIDRAEFEQLTADWAASTGSSAERPPSSGARPPKPPTDRPR